MPAFDVISGLTTYVTDTHQIVSPEFSEQLVMNLVPQANRIYVDKEGTYVVRVMKLDESIGACCVDDSSTLNFIEGKVVVKCFKKSLKFCETDVQEAADGFNWDADNESLGALNAELANRVLQAVISGLNKVLLMGKSAANGGTDLVDGILTQVSGSAITKAFTTGTLQDAFIKAKKALPKDGYTTGNILALIGTTGAESFFESYIGSNRTPYNGVSVHGYQALDTATAGVYTGIVMPQKQLLGGFAKGSRGVEGKVATDVIKDTSENYFRYLWKNLYGIGILIATDVVVFTYTQDVMDAMIGIPVSVVSPLTPAGAISTGA